MIYTLTKLSNNKEEIIKKVKSKKELEKEHKELIQKHQINKSLDWNVCFTLMTKNKEEYSWFNNKKEKIK